MYESILWFHMNFQFKKLMYEFLTLFNIFDLYVKVYTY